MLASGLERSGHDVLLFTTEDSTRPVPRDPILPSAFARMGAALADPVPAGSHLPHSLGLSLEVFMIASTPCTSWSPTALSTGVFMTELSIDPNERSW